MLLDWSATYEKLTRSMNITTIEAPDENVSIGSDRSRVSPTETCRNKSEPVHNSSISCWILSDFCRFPMQSWSESLVQESDQKLSDIRKC